MFFLVPLLVEVAAVPGMVALLAAQLDLQAGKTSELVQHLTTVRESVEQCRAALQHMQDCRPQVSRNQTKPNLSGYNRTNTSKSSGTKPIHLSK